MTIEIEGLSSIADMFDAVVVDQYGVLHDGRTSFTGALDALQGLRYAGIPIVALTNSGKRAKTNAARLARFGFPGELFKAVVSSGELARDRLADLASGTPVLLVARDGETELLDELPLVSVSSPGEADLVVIAAVEPERYSRDDYARLLEPHAERRTPALSVNPDLLMTVGDGYGFGAGAVAEDYQALGCPVETLGKPAPAIFEAALEALDHPVPERVLMIGDSPAHDIAGASAMGMSTLLIRGGVQSELSGSAADFSAPSLRWTRDQ